MFLYRIVYSGQSHFISFPPLSTLLQAWEVLHMKLLDILCKLSIVKNEMLQLKMLSGR